MVICARELLQYRESRDPKVISGRHQSEDWKEESRLHNKALSGSVTVARGLGFFPTTHYNKAKGKERQDLVRK